MTRRQLLLSAAAPRSKPQDLIVVLCDDLGYGDLGCYGHPTIKTPNLDAFARQGMTFTDAYAAAPVCSPSRCGMLTGRTPFRLGVYDWIPPGSAMHLQRDEVTFATLLRQQGYATCHSGKWHANGLFNSPAQPQPSDHGFDHWFSTQNNAGPSHENPVNFIRNGQKVGPLKGYSSQIIVDEALTWMQSVPRQKPINLFLCFHSPHEPIATSPAFVDRYPAARKAGEALYYGNVTELDYHFGRFLDGLQAAGRGDALVIFTSDNGPETLLRYPAGWRSHGSASPLRGMKLSLYEGGYRVPAIARWPGHIKPGAVSAEPICGVDFLPTFAAIARAPLPPKPLDGASILPSFQGKAVKREKPLHWHYFNALDAPRATLRSGDWKITGAWAKDGPSASVSGFKPEHLTDFKVRPLEVFELFNLKADKAETTNLAAKEPKRLAAMRDQLIQAHKDVC
ncbi:MAG: sulfatase-like hydrolase/transferase [Bryobacterales bacterium]|nr:sulfatase-like hydrolase/transferase [Bryobacterales bacterium]